MAMNLDMFNRMDLTKKLMVVFTPMFAFSFAVSIMLMFSLAKVSSTYNYITEQRFAAFDSVAEMKIATEAQIHAFYAFAAENGSIEMKNKFSAEAAEFDKWIGQQSEYGKIDYTAAEFALLEKVKEDHVKLTQLGNRIMEAYGTAGFKTVYDQYMPELDRVYTDVGPVLNTLEDDLSASMVKMDKDADKVSNAAFRRGIIALVLIMLCLPLMFWFTINSIVTPLKKSIAMLSAGSDQVTSASGQIASAGQELAQGASEQASSLEETSSALEEMTSMVQQNAENARQADSMAVEAGQLVINGIKAVNRMAASITDIKRASDETAKIIKTIDEISFQTNLLALNAAVEAARAGESGKGFAVVAEEVRNLARRSSDAARSTGELIAGVKSNVENGVALAENSAKALAEINDKVNKTSSIIKEVSSSSEEQARGIVQINTAVAEMDKVTQRNSANAEETASATEELSSQASELMDVVAILKSLAGSSAAVMSKTPEAAAKHIVKKHAAARPHEIRTQAKKYSPAPVKSVKRPSPQSIIPLNDDTVLKEF